MLYSQIVPVLFFTLLSSFIISVSSEGPKFGVVKPPLRRSSTPTSASDPPFETPKISLIMILKKVFIENRTRFDRPIRLVGVYRANQNHT